MFEQTSQVLGWRSFWDLFRQLSTALGTDFGNKMRLPLWGQAVETLHRAAVKGLCHRHVSSNGRWGGMMIRCVRWVTVDAREK